MGKILVVNEDRCWYQSIASLENYYEIQLEQRILKHAEDVFQGYYTLSGKYNFKNTKQRTSTADILLISKDFSTWVIVEVELSKKSLTHTKEQLRVFTDSVIDGTDLLNYVLKQVPQLTTHKQQLITLFDTTPPNVLVIFDSYNNHKLEKLKSLFRQIDICVFELHKTNIHDFEVYRLSGDYPYIYTGYSYLTEVNFNTYKVDTPAFFQNTPLGPLFLLYKTEFLKVELARSEGDYFIIINKNQFAPSQTLVVSLTSNNELILTVSNP